MYNSDNNIKIRIISEQPYLCGIILALWGRIKCFHNSYKLTFITTRNRLAYVIDGYLVLIL